MKKINLKKPNFEQPLSFNQKKVKQPQFEFLINSELSSPLKEKLQEKIDSGKKILFAVVGDLTETGDYGQSVFAVCENAFLTITETLDLEFAFDSFEKISFRRLYGNSCVEIVDKDESENTIFRCTYNVAFLIDVAVQFIKNIKDGKNLKDELDIVEVGFEKLNFICPKCGRMLLKIGAECINCQSKSLIVSKMVKYVKPELPMLLICVLISGITTALSLLPPYMTRTIVDDILPKASTSEIDIALKMLTQVIIVLVSSHILRHLLAMLRGYLTSRSSHRIILDLKKDLFEKAQRLPMKFYDKTSVGAVITRINGDVGAVQGFMLKITQECIVQFITLVGIVIIMLVTHPQLTLLSLIPVPIVVAGSKFFASKIAPYYRRIWLKNTAVISTITDTLPCIKIVKSFSGEDRASGRFNQRIQTWYDVSMESAKVTQTFPQIISFFVTCGSLLIWAIGGKWALTGNVSAGLLVSFISYASMFYGPVNFFAHLSDSYQNALASTERILDILDCEPEYNKQNAKKVEKLDGKIEFKNVNFAFDKTKKVLSNINLTIEPGDIVGVVGKTGSGKTTLINLLMRFYDDYEGKILVDGQNVKDIDLNSFRNCIGFVQQEPMMFADSIFNNIAYGVPDATVKDVISAAETANAHEFILKQPEAYDTMLGERGIGLSGGEKQRLSIARAVIKKPSILIFDEATASVDSATEKLIQDAINKLVSNNTTTIMIAHRLSTLKKANKIVVIDQGKIAECGTPEELLAKKGKYYDLVNIQSMTTENVVKE